ncbi:MAG: hypothetical protein R2824_16035 [Saprospiraceae bacterium]
MDGFSIWSIVSGIISNVLTTLGMKAFSKKEEDNTFQCQDNSRSEVSQQNSPPPQIISNFRIAPKEIILFNEKEKNVSKLKETKSSGWDESGSNFDSKIAGDSSYIVIPNLIMFLAPYAIIFVLSKLIYISEVTFWGVFILIVILQFSYRVFGVSNFSKSSSSSPKSSFSRPDHKYPKDGSKLEEDFTYENPLADDNFSGNFNSPFSPPFNNSND